MTRTRMITMASLGAVLATGIAAVSVGTLRADVQADFVEFETDEYVTFEFTPGDLMPVLTYSGPRAADVLTIPIEFDGNCTVTNGSALDVLLRLEQGEGGWSSVQFYENGFGTGEAKCTPRDGRIGADDPLQIAPGTLFEDSGAVEGFTAARLNIEGKFGTTLQYTTTADGETFLTSDQVTLSEDGGDNGNDARGDNVLVDIVNLGDAPFTELTIYPTGSGNNAEIALDNGGDSQDPGWRSIFYFGGETFEYTVDCGDTVTEDFTDSDGETPISVRFLRLENLPRTDNPETLAIYGDATCADDESDAIGVQIDFTEDGANETGDGALRDLTEILNSTRSADGEPQAVRARVEITWRVDRLDGDGEPRPMSDIELELQREITYPIDDGTDTEPVVIPWCLSIADLDAVGGTTEYDIFDATDPGVAVHPDDRPDGEPSWCIVADERILDGETINQIVTFDASGDPGMW